jgi:hypothetical protein
VTAHESPGISECRLFLAPIHCPRLQRIGSLYAADGPLVLAQVLSLRGEQPIAQEQLEHPMAQERLEVNGER